MNDIALNKVESMFIALMKKNKTEYKSEIFINKILIEFLLENIENNTDDLKFIFEKNNFKDIETVKSFLYTSRDYYVDKKNLDTLIDDRCDAWKLFDNSKETFRFLLNLVIYTMYDSKLENFEPDLGELITNIFIDLSKINLDLLNSFESMLYERLG